MYLTNVFYLFILKKILFIYSRETQRERGAEIRQREKQAPYREPYAGLDPGSPGSRPGPKSVASVAKPLSHLGRSFSKIFFFQILFIYSRETQIERGRDTGRGRSRLHAGSPMWDLIPGLQDHALGRRQHQTAGPPGLPNP